MTPGVYKRKSEFVQGFLCGKSFFIQTADPVIVTFQPILIRNTPGRPSLRQRGENSFRQPVVRGSYAHGVVQRPFQNPGPPARLHKFPEIEFIAGNRVKPVQEVGQAHGPLDEMTDTDRVGHLPQIFGKSDHFGFPFAFLGRIVFLQTGLGPDHDPLFHGLDRVLQMAGPPVGIHISQGHAVKSARIMHRQLQPFNGHFKRFSPSSQPAASARLPSAA